ncbi:MAG: orotidine-5'-phosphate decarboxylase [Ectothiorhodospiraceae bacterium]|nr:orotidine-5'-phosphate decarboxylase [Ectothiorhodospiraceae bacterium]
MNIPAVRGPRVVVALDFQEARDALSLVDQLDPTQCRLKVGKELFVRAGPALVEKLTGRGFEVFLDLKFHDIPNTVAGACRAAAQLGVWMVNVHASGGRAMMEAAREAVDSAGASSPLLIAVTVLTSSSSQVLAETGADTDVGRQVLRLARLSADAGLDGVVCSAQEAGELREVLGQAPLLVTPGIRPAGEESGDQHRILPPAAAIAAGSSFLVVGRPVTRAQDPVVALEQINREIGQVLTAGA